MKAAKLTSKFQTTIPREIRDRLALGAGDYVAFEVNEETGLITLKKATELDLEFARAVESTLTSEWSSENDEKAYDSL
jgi:AbrB family looped-hinge helix DNA binding protein